MPTGVVTWYNDAKGFGFIQLDDGGDSITVHHSEIQGDGFKTLTKDQKVSYESVEDTKSSGMAFPGGAKGPMAKNVSVVD